MSTSRSKSDKDRLQQRDEIVTEQEHNRVEWHLDVPACRTLRGLKIHIDTIGLREAWWLCYQCNCDSLKQLVAVMWQLIRLRRKK